MYRQKHFSYNFCSAQAQKNTAQTGQTRSTSSKRLRLLPSGPDRVHAEGSHRTQSSSRLYHYTLLWWKLQVQIEGDAGAPRPRPSPKSLLLSGLSFWGDGHWAKGPARGGRAGLQGSRRTTGAPRRGTCKAPPIRHGNCRDTFPSGEGGWVARARAGLPYGRPTSLMLARSAMVERGGDLLRRPTEVTQAPPAMGRRRIVAARLYRNGWERLGFLAPDPRQRAA